MKYYKTTKKIIDIIFDYDYENSLKDYIQNDDDLILIAYEISILKADGMKREELINPQHSGCLTVQVLGISRFPSASDEIFASLQSILRSSLIRRTDRLLRREVWPPTASTTRSHLSSISVLEKRLGSRGASETLKRKSVLFETHCENSLERVNIHIDSDFGF